MNKISVTTRELFDKLVNTSALTIEGLAEESIPEFIDWIKQYTDFKKPEVDVYITKGKVMNNFCKLTGNNAYKDDLTIVSVMLDDMVNFNTIVGPRFQIGGRWFDDIVSNNTRREQEKE